MSVRYHMAIFDVGSVRTAIPLGIHVVGTTAVG